jgi:ribulose-5-phosphate 4-epimerase/fuculose-1-phosphate aldolase
VPIFDIHDAAGDTDLLIGNMQLARQLVDSLTTKSVVLMRGHGSVAVGTSLKQAVYRAVYTEMNAKLQSEAIRLGGRVAFLTPGEAERAAALTDPNLERPWSLWSLQAGAR